MVHGMGWNGLESSRMNLACVAMALGIQRNELGICWNGIPLGFQMEFQHSGRSPSESARSHGGW